MTLARVASPLSQETEELVRTIIACCIAVHSDLGPGLSELVYVSACCIELQSRRISFEREKSLPVTYRGKFVCNQRVDILVEGKVVVEAKSVERIHPVHIAQTVSYLRLTGMRVGLIVNFNVDHLRHGIRRVVL